MVANGTVQCNLLGDCLRCGLYRLMVIRWMACVDGWDLFEEKEEV